MDPGHQPQPSGGNARSDGPGSASLPVRQEGHRKENPPLPPFAFAKRFGLLVQEIHDGEALVFCKANPNHLALTELRRFLGKPLRLAVLGHEKFNQHLTLLYEQGSGAAMQMMEDLGEDMDLSAVARKLSEPEDLLEADDDAPVIRLINALLSEAIKQNASDVHIEPLENRLAVRFRIDGILREVLQPQRELAPIITSRVKVMSRLDIAEKRLPQDGRISLRLAGRAVDVRVSTIPSAHGERVVMRLLDKQAGRLDLEQLGMPAGTLARMAEVIQRPHGILLVTGPTGSGKTTTLYAALSRLNDRSRNIMTVEDPIEYFLDGVGQTQVNPKVDMSFARGLRAILRQDPDVVMVGEIRDLETVQIAVQASLTGHLVLSTLHTNTAIGAITRLRDMGAEPFLLSSSLLGMLAQRLIRILCPDCRRPYQATPADKARAGIAATQDVQLFAAVGCPRCDQSGYRGRTGIYELITVDERLRGMIHDGASEQSMLDHVRLSTPSMWDSGKAEVLAGRTSLEELLRVTIG